MPVLVPVLEPEPEPEPVPVLVPVPVSEPLPPLVSGVEGSEGCWTWVVRTMLAPAGALLPEGDMAVTTPSALDPLARLTENPSAWSWERAVR